MLFLQNYRNKYSIPNKNKKKCSYVYKMYISYSTSHDTGAQAQFFLIQFAVGFLSVMITVCLQKIGKKNSSYLCHRNLISVWGKQFISYFKSNSFVNQDKMISKSLFYILLHNRASVWVNLKEKRYKRNSEQKSTVSTNINTKQNLFT